MKKTSIVSYIALLTGLLLVNTACEDEELSPYLEPLPGVHAFAEVPDGEPSSFVYLEPEVAIPFDIQWISVDQELEVSKIDLYILFNENYTDADGNPRVARHGGTEGVLFQTIEGGDLPGNRTAVSFSISQSEVYQLYQGVTYDYDGDGEATDVFNNPDNPRNAQRFPFVPGDDFAVRWELTTTDGLLYDSWSPSVCTELPGANCEVAWGMSCTSDLAGTYTYTSSGQTDGRGPFNTSGTETFVALGGGKYSITDLSSGMEPTVWENPPVAATLIDACGSIQLDAASFEYIYGYEVTGGSVNPDTGVITVTWKNVYEEGGTTVYTPAE
uniref:SusE outer membrane protein domain-containing protein n=1 Tax=Roseihalotalea indica TaxID=2867963 RepID=A0AA49GTD9_9BACT|nr:hypothetical protein K4G66_06220 [Tunicatimonas sp. TK19036]